jgi:hypothetical protein
MTRYDHWQGKKRLAIQKGRRFGDLFFVSSISLTEARLFSCLTQVLEQRVIYRLVLIAITPPAFPVPYFVVASHDL